MCATEAVDVVSREENLATRTRIAQTVDAMRAINKTDLCRSFDLAQNTMDCHAAKLARGGVIQRTLECAHNPQHVGTAAGHPGPAPRLGMVDDACLKDNGNATDEPHLQSDLRGNP